jgi:hypothetical protein
VSSSSADTGRLNPRTFLTPLVAVQSLCLFSAVARIPVGLALLAFNTYRDTTRHDTARPGPAPSNVNPGLSVPA